jgi:hypothetical protein
LIVRAQVVLVLAVLAPVAPVQVVRVSIVQDLIARKAEDPPQGAPVPHLVLMDQANRAGSPGPVPQIDQAVPADLAVQQGPAAPAGPAETGVRAAAQAGRQVVVADRASEQDRPAGVANLLSAASPAVSASQDLAANRAEGLRVATAVNG